MISSRVTITSVGPVFGAPIAAAYVKEAVIRGADLALEQGLRLEADLSILLHATADRAKGLASFADGTRAEYEGR